MHHAAPADGGKSSAPASAPLGDPWSQEPPRHPALISRSEKPCNAETPGHILAASLITSSDVFYVRWGDTVLVLPILCRSRLHPACRVLRDFAGGYEFGCAQEPPAGARG
jgi:hypothetical protein